MKKRILSLFLALTLCLTLLPTSAFAEGGDVSISDGVAVLRRVQRRREGFVCTAIRAVRSCHRSGLNDRLVDREFHGC